MGRRVGSLMPKPVKLPLKFPRLKSALYDMGVELVARFCEVNRIFCPDFCPQTKETWFVNACAYYRPQYIAICTDHCAYPCGEEYSRAWSWPGNTTDREPYGVLAHELGHHADYTVGGVKGDYWSEHSTEIMKSSGEKPISSYCPNPAEWYAEMFRVFVTNPDLLRHLRPRTYDILCQRWEPVVDLNWQQALGENVPARVIKALERKGAR